MATSWKVCLAKIASFLLFPSVVRNDPKVYLRHTDVRLRTHDPRVFFFSFLLNLYHQYIPLACSSDLLLFIRIFIRTRYGTILFNTKAVVVCFHARKTAEFGRAFMCGVRTYLNFPQLLPLLGDKSKVCSRKHSRHLVVFRVCILLLHAEDTASALCISGFCTDAYFVRWFVLRVLAVPKYSQSALYYTWSMNYTSTVCAPCRQFSGPSFGSNHSQMIPRVGVREN